jgi:hypothetical protein
VDIFSHALAGAATGLPFGHPVLGAVVAALPDAVLGLHRRAAPTTAYNLTHSLLGLWAATVVASLLGWEVATTVCLALLSHLALDMPTHGKQWAPPLLFPWWHHRFSAGSEWEFFNASWWYGFKITLLWISTCVLAYIFGTGYPF